MKRIAKAKNKFNIFIEEVPIPKILPTEVLIKSRYTLVSRGSEIWRRYVRPEAIQQKMMGRFIPQSFIEQASPWDPIIQLISQQLDLEKSIFLARKEDDHRVVEIRAINCNLDDIQERINFN